MSWNKKLKQITGWKKPSEMQVYRMLSSNVHAINQAVDQERKKESDSRSLGIYITNEGASEDGRIIVRRVGSYSDSTR